MAQGKLTLKLSDEALEELQMLKDITTAACDAIQKLGIILNRCEHGEKVLRVAIENARAGSFRPVHFVVDIVENYLRENGFDGLYFDENKNSAPCQCSIDSIAACDGPFPGCKPAHLKTDGKLHPGKKGA